ncbi:hypothetical protein CDCA_CDCA17G4457 [Cyanidium caldarium]|uniref:Protein kinase domain-containing protein n=1 Tax=Cyanidium caldarium TaxID=2771 RepID=A0AAV9J1I4_CYACA|nr:hypothetical protein CDCA_CDCA17G4457 [Cyanidium caldarium]
MSGAIGEESPRLRPKEVIRVVVQEHVRWTAGRGADARELDMITEDRVRRLYHGDDAGGRPWVVQEDAEGVEVGDGVRYCRGGMIGKGGYSEVWRAVRTSAALTEDAWLVPAVAERYRSEPIKSRMPLRPEWLQQSMRPLLPVTMVATAMPSTSGAMPPPLAPPEAPEGSIAPAIRFVAAADWPSHLAVVLTQPVAVEVVDKLWLSAQGRLCMVREVAALTALGGWCPAVGPLASAAADSPAAAQWCEALSLRGHDNIVRLYDVCEDEQHIYLVMELIAAGDLFDRVIERTLFRESDAIDCALSIFRALQHCHAHRVLHRDVKPDNLCFLSREPHAPDQSGSTLVWRTCTRVRRCGRRC